MAAPVTGTILGILTGWLSEQITAILEDDCDGGVALENFVRRGDDWSAITSGGQPVVMRVEHDGTDSPFRCGFNSEYVVTWSICRSRE